MAYAGVATTDDTAQRIIGIHDKLYADRANFTNTWQSVAQRVLPNYSDFITQWTEGQRRTNLVFESTAVISLEHFCAGMESLLCPASQRWHSLRPMDPRLWEDIEVMQWMDQVTDVLFRSRYAPTANFQAQVHECFAQIGAFGNGPFLCDDIVGYGLRYRSLHLAECFGIENAAGQIDHIQRKYKLTAKAAVDAVEKGIFDDVSEKIREAAQGTQTLTDKFEFIHAVYPNPDYVPGKRRQSEYPVKSCIVELEKKVLVKESGYHTMPMFFPRYRVAPKETYGRGPGVDALPDILMLQEMEKADIRITQRNAEPPIMLADDGSLSGFDFRGNALNYGMLSSDGKPLAAPFNTGGNFEVMESKLDQKRKVIQAAFNNDIFSILIEPSPNMTATEVLQRAQEKGQLLAPMLGRIQAELFGPMITRELDILHRRGQLPPPPNSVRDNGGLAYEIVYESSIQVNQRRDKALAIASTLQQLTPLIEMDKTGDVLKQFNLTRTAQIIANSNGAPAGILNTPEEMQAVQAAQAQQQQLTNLAQIAGPASSAIKNLSLAQQAASSTTPGSTMGAQQ